MKTSLKIAVSLFSILFSGTALAVQFENNVPAAVKDLAVSDLAFLQSIVGHQQSPLHVPLVGKVDGVAYIAWFSERVDTFGYDSDDHTGAIAYNDSSLIPNHMMVTDYFVKGNLPQVARLMTLLHEARHSEEPAGFWHHAICPVPFVDEAGHEITSIFSGLTLAGFAGCDVNVHGAYGTATILINNIGRFCENCADKIRQDAALYSRDQANRIITPSEHTLILKDATDIAPPTVPGATPTPAPPLPAAPATVPAPTTGAAPVIVNPAPPVPAPVMRVPAWPAPGAGSWRPPATSFSPGDAPTTWPVR